MTLEIELLLKKDLTNLISALGATNYRMKILSKKKYISKKKMKEIMKQQDIYLSEIQAVKDKLLNVQGWANGKDYLKDDWSLYETLDISTIKKGDFLKLIGGTIEQEVIEVGIERQSNYSYIILYNDVTSQRSQRLISLEKYIKV